MRHQNDAGPDPVQHPGGGTEGGPLRPANVAACINAALITALRQMSAVGNRATTGIAMHQVDLGSSANATPGQFRLACAIDAHGATATLAGLFAAHAGWQIETRHDADPAGRQIGANRVPMGADSTHVASTIVEALARELERIRVLIEPAFAGGSCAPPYAGNHTGQVEVAGSAGGDHQSIGPARGHADRTSAAGPCIPLDLFDISLSGPDRYTVILPGSATTSVSLMSPEPGERLLAALAESVMHGRKSTAAVTDGRGQAAAPVGPGGAP